MLGLYKDDLRSTATELWQTIVRLETEKYDLQERQKRQDYDVSRHNLQYESSNIFLYQAEGIKRKTATAK